MLIIYKALTRAIFKVCNLLPLCRFTGHSGEDDRSMMFGDHVGKPCFKEGRNGQQSSTAVSKRMCEAPHNFAARLFKVTVILQGCRNWFLYRFACRCPLSPAYHKAILFQKASLYMHSYPVPCTSVGVGRRRGTDVGRGELQAHLLARLRMWVWQICKCAVCKTREDFKRSVCSLMRTLSSPAYQATHVSPTDMSAHYKRTKKYWHHNLLALRTRVFCGIDCCFYRFEPSLLRHHHPAL